MKRFLLGLVPGVVFGTCVALAASGLASGSPGVVFEALVADVARSLAALRADEPMAGPVDDALLEQTSVTAPEPASVRSVEPASVPASLPASVAESLPGVVVGDGATSSAGERHGSPMAVEADSVAAVVSVDSETGSDSETEAETAVELPEAFAEDYAWWGRIEDGPGRRAGVELEQPVARVLPEGASAPAALQASSDLAAQLPASAASDSVDATDATPLASVWVPFHSERSATGFARRLTRALERPFSVSRQGAGRYQVVFAYTDAEERDAVFARVAQITGEGP